MARKRAFVVVMVVMLGGLAALVVPTWTTQSATADDSPTSADAETATATPTETETAPASAGTTSNDEGTRVGEQARPTDQGPSAEPAAPLMDRPLRVAAQSWPLLAPGLLASTPPAKSSDAFGGAPLGVIFERADVATLEAMLARGGADERGADLALMTLPDLVRSYDRLRALEPRIVFVAGWSRGGHGLWGERGAVVDGRARKLSAVTSSPAAFLGAWLLEAGGANLGELRLVPGEDGPWSARDAESSPEGLYPCVTTHHANLVPYVLVTPAGFVDSNRNAIAAFLAKWLDGVARLSADVPAAGRSVAGIGGLPDAAAIVRDLGRVEFVGLAENAKAFGLSGRGLTNLGWLFEETWRVYRSFGVTQGPAPRVPTDGSAFGAVLLARGGVGEEGPVELPREGGEAVLRKKFASDDPQALVEALGVFAGTFPRSPLRLSIRRSRTAPTAEAVATRAAERYGFDAARITSGTRPPAGAAATIEVLADH